MTPQEMDEYVRVAAKSSGWSFTRRMRVLNGQEPVTLAMVKAERRRRSRVMRDAISPGSPAGPELQSQVVTTATDGWRALESWQAGVRPGVFPSEG
jgi:hypothetical protein